MAIYVCIKQLCLLGVAYDQPPHKKEEETTKTEREREGERESQRTERISCLRTSLRL